MADKTYELEEISGVEGNSLYLNDHRISGPKPWGGGRLVRTWHIDGDDLINALNSKKS